MSTTNARREFESEVEEFEVRCAWVCFDEIYSFNEENRIYLREGYIPEEYEEFLQKIDREYDAGYGTQHLTGIIWLKDGNWIVREEYDGSELWSHKSLPEIPEKCTSPAIKSSAKQ